MSVFFKISYTMKVLSIESQVIASFFPLFNNFPQDGLHDLNGFAVDFVIGKKSG